MKCACCEEEVDDALQAAAEDPSSVLHNAGQVFHRGCFFRLFIGSVGHQKRECGCYVPGSGVGDPPGMTPREAAAAALRYYNRVRLIIGQTEEVSNGN